MSFSKKNGNENAIWMGMMADVPELVSPVDWMIQIKGEAQKQEYGTHVLSLFPDIPE